MGKGNEGREKERKERGRRDGRKHTRNEVPVTVLNPEHKSNLNEFSLTEFE